MVTKLKAGVKGSQYLIVLAVQVLAEVVHTPVRHIRPAPQSIATAGIGDRRRESSGATGAGNQQPHAFSGAADAHGDVRHGDKPGIGNPHHIDAIDALKIRNRGEYCLIEAGCFAIEVDVLNAIDPTNRGIPASSLEHCVDHRIVLQIGSIDDQGEVVNGHFLTLVFRRTLLVRATRNEATHL
ncbi:MAG: hypothetical protein OXI15_04895, partial [Chromatiales bacterium]|nr:hypothetical protein [Chromatiales bacterium]